MSAQKSVCAEGEGLGLPALYATVALDYITLKALAQALGRTNARAARDWCQRHHIHYRRDGKHSWVRLDDVRQVLARLPLHRVPDNDVRESAASAAVAALMKKR